MFDLEANISSWCDHLRYRGKMTEDSVLELESHLRDEIEDLTNSGLTSDEAFIISVKRLGNVNAISNEYSKTNMTTFWKNLLINKPDRNSERDNRKKIILVVIFSLLSGTLAKIPDLFGYDFFNSNSTLFYFKNLCLFVFPFIALYFLITRKSSRKYYFLILAVFCLAAVLVNIYPSFSPYNTVILTAIHLPIFLWLFIGAAYVGKFRNEIKGRMDFLRFTGEAIIYSGLIFCGIVFLGMFILTIFSTINIYLFDFLSQYLFVYGGCAAVITATYLVEAKKSIVENFAPVLAKIFTPLFLITLVGFLIALIVTGKSIYGNREFLISFDIMLAVVLALVIYVISARGMNDSPNIFDYMNLAIIIIALVINIFAISAIIYRLSEYGISPNKLAALGENIVLMINLGGLAVLYLNYFIRKIGFDLIEKWQTGYLYIYAVWTSVVAFIFPIAFKFR